MSDAVHDALLGKQNRNRAVSILRSADSPGSDNATLALDRNPLAIIEGLDRAGCISEWKNMVGDDVPKHLSITFMRKALTYEWQCKAFGRLPSSARRTLTAVANGKPIEDATRPPIQSGTHLMREWNGRTYLVEVINDGFLLDGRKYRSLSAIARKITGAHWSGPRFFGVNRPSLNSVANQQSTDDLQQIETHRPSEAPA
jgi:hypothetical protein